MPTVPAKVLDLVATFARNSDEYQSPAFNEAMLRQQFVNPLFRELGWDMDNAQGHAEAYKDVIHEASLKIGETGSRQFAERRVADCPYNSKKRFYRQAESASWPGTANRLQKHASTGLRALPMPSRSPKTG